jgi:hypothetical protein
LIPPSICGSKQVVAPIREPFGESPANLSDDFMLAKGKSTQDPFVNLFTNGRYKGEEVQHVIEVKESPYLIDLLSNSQTAP